MKIMCQYMLKMKGPEEPVMSANGSVKELVLENESIYIIYSHASKTEKGMGSHSRCSE